MRLIELSAGRLAARKRHLMPSTLLQSRLSRWVWRSAFYRAASFLGDAEAAHDFGSITRLQPLKARQFRDFAGRHEHTTGYPGDPLRG